MVWFGIVGTIEPLLAMVSRKAVTALLADVFLIALDPVIILSHKSKVSQWTLMKVCEFYSWD
jgi:hypothetical protein